MNGQFSAGWGGRVSKRCATFACACMILFFWGVVRWLVQPGLYVSRSFFVNCLSGWSVIPATPASSYSLSAKNSGLPGGGCICLLWTSAVACSCS